MIAVKMHDNNGGITLLLLFEPGNLEKLKEGKPIHKWLNEFIPELPMKVELMIGYSPDVEWVAEQMEGSLDALKMARLIEESLTRKPVVRGQRTAEELRKAGQ